MWSSSYHWPSEADNYDVYCERCQRVHPYYTMTQEKWDGIIAEAGKNLAEALVIQGIEKFYDSER